MSTGYDKRVEAIIMRLSNEQNPYAKMLMNQQKKLEEQEHKTEELDKKISNHEDRLSAIEDKLGMNE